jgi:chromosome segregation ATPase
VGRMSVRMQSVTNAHSAARRLGGGARPNIKQNGSADGRRSGGLTISAQRVKGPDKQVTALPPINPQANRELEALKARVAELTEQLTAGKQSTQSAREAATAEAARADSLAARLQKLTDAEAAVRAELGGKLTKAEAATSQLRAELERVQRDAAEAPQAQPEPTVCSECESLRHRLDVAERNLEQTSKERADLERTVEDTRASAAALQEQVADLQEQLAQANASQERLDADRAVSDAEIAAAVTSWKGRVGELESELSASRAQAEEKLRQCQAQLLTSENRAKALSTQLEIEKEHVAEAAELDTLRDKVRRLEAVARDRDRSSVREISQLEKRIEELSADVRAKQSKLNKQEQELRSAIASTDKEASFLKKMEEQFDDDSYEAVLLEELSEMRARFQDKLDKLQESCNDIERRCRAELRIERDGWAAEKQGLESRCLQLSQRCAQYDAELDRLRASNANRA